MDAGSWIHDIQDPGYPGSWIRVDVAACLDLAVRVGLARPRVGMWLSVLNSCGRVLARASPCHVQSGRVLAWASLVHVQSGSVLARAGPVHVQSGRVLAHAGLCWPMPVHVGGPVRAAHMSDKNIRGGGLGVSCYVLLAWSPAPWDSLRIQNA